jgi:NADPH:quinone reductase
MLEPDVQAVVIEEFGPPEVLALREAADPRLGRGDVLVEVEFSSVTFVDTQIRSGRAPRPSMLPQLPAILGNGVGGRVVAVGAEVDGDLVGARALATTGGTGGYAQLASVPAAAIISIPAEVAMGDAVALLADGRTAVGLIDRAAIQPGETVLVEAAAGGVGSLLVQLARRDGARVVAVAGGERKLEVARALGAEIAVDYRRPSWAEEVRSAVGDYGVDVVFDGVGGSTGRDAFQLLRRGGRLCTFGMAAGSFAAISDEELTDCDVTRLRGAVADAREMAALSARALSSAAAGELRAVIGQEHPLANAAEAHRAIEARATIGKTLLVP